MNTSTSLLGPLMLDLVGVSLTDRERRFIADERVGGIILFTRNYNNREQLRELIADIRAIQPGILIAVDHEGGRVQRFREGFTPIPAMQRLGLQYERDPELALQQSKQIAWIMASELLCEDIDFSFAPVLDLEYGRSAVIGDRSFSSHAASLIAVASAFLDGMHEAGMSTTGKHFPGHGYVEADSHVAIPVDDRELELILKDAEIFKSLNHQLDGMMPAHVIYPCLDSEPAGFSKTWCQDILRQQFGFSGVIFSDDLSMEGASVAGSYPERAQLALDAGCNMILLCNDPDGADELLDNMPTYDKSKTCEVLDSMRADQYAFDSHETLIESEQWREALSAIKQLEGIS